MEVHAFFPILLATLLAARILGELAAGIGSILLLLPIFAKLGRAAGIFSNDVYAAMVPAIAFSALLPPFVLKRFHGRHGARCARHWSKA